MGRFNDELLRLQNFEAFDMLFSDWTRSVYSFEGLKIFINLKLYANVITIERK